MNWARKYLERFPEDKEFVHENLDPIGSEHRRVVQAVEQSLRIVRIPRKIMGQPGPKGFYWALCNPDEVEDYQREHDPNYFARKYGDLWPQDLEVFLDSLLPFMEVLPLFPEALKRGERIVPLHREGTEDCNFHGFTLELHQPKTLQTFPPKPWCQRIPVWYKLGNAALAEQYFEQTGDDIIKLLLLVPPIFGDDVTLWLEAAIESNKWIIPYALPSGRVSYQLRAKHEATNMQKLQVLGTPVWGLLWRGRVESIYFIANWMSHWRNPSEWPYLIHALENEEPGKKLVIANPKARGSKEGARPVWVHENSKKEWEAQNPGWEIL